MVSGIIISTQFGNFRNPQDLYRYMLEENILKANVTCYYWNEDCPASDMKKLKMTLQEVKNWSEGNLII